MPKTPTKTCASCGRTIVWRAKWARSWADVRWCSQTCRRRGVNATDAALEQWLRERLAQSSSAVDPAEAALAVAGTHTDHSVLEAARRAARRVVAAGQADMLQHGRPVDPSTAKGPVSLRRRRPG